MKNLACLIVGLISVFGCGGPFEVYGGDAMSPAARIAAAELVGACTEFRKGERDYWDDVLGAASSKVASLSAKDRYAVYTAVAAECSLDASYGLAYRKLIWNDRGGLQAHLSQLLGSEGDARLTETQRMRVQYVIDIAKADSPPE